MDRNDLLHTFTLANDFKEGDLLVGGSDDEYLRREARSALSAHTLGQIRQSVFADDGLTEALIRSLDIDLAGELANLTIAEMKRVLLGTDGVAWIEHYRGGLSSEAIAAVVKLMSDDELGRVARSVFNPLPGQGTTIGSAGHFGSRVQPNSPGDDEEEILFSILEGLTYGCGDVIIGVNPASDDLETIIRLEQLLQSVVEWLELPTRYCVLSDIVKQTAARQHTKVDVGFQSLAGTSKALKGMVGLDVEEILDLARGFEGLYFETGQGSEVTNQAAEGVDMVTLEARAYGVARYIKQRTGSWMIVNDVAGFIGPEVFRTERQLLRACLEDSVMAKLHGLTMGLDVCSTFHMAIDPSELRRLTARVAEQAAPAYLMAVAGNADPMLGYMTTSFRDQPRIRRLTGKRISSSMEHRLSAVKVMTPSGELNSPAIDASSLYAVYTQAGGDTRSEEALREEGSRKVKLLQAKNFDLGYGWRADFEPPSEIGSRVDDIYSHARQALYATMDRRLLKDSSGHTLWVKTVAADREDYLSHPSSGESIRREDVGRITALYPVRRPQIQIVISDGLNASAVNENVGLLLPPLLRLLRGSGFDVGRVAIAVENGRVRAGYQIGELLGAELLIHLIGERPGTGLNTLSAYLTYGRDGAGYMRWSSNMDHSWTTAVCGINTRAKPPEVAVAELMRLTARMFENRCSGVALG